MQADVYARGNEQVLYIHLLRGGQPASGCEETRGAVMAGAWQKLVAGFFSAYPSCDGGNMKRVLVNENMFVAPV